MPKGIFLGLATVDLLYRLPRFVVSGEKLPARERYEFGGGPAANAAATFSLLGGEALLLAQIGSHPLSAIIIDDLSSCGVFVEDLAPERAESPATSCIMITDGSSDRTIVSSPASRHLPGVPSTLSFEDVDTLLVDGHEMAASVDASKRARNAGARVVLDAGSWKTGTEELLSQTDIVVASADFWPPKIRSHQDVLRFLVDHGISSAAITRGSKPILYVDQGRSGDMSVPDIEAVDTLAAGDVFHGAFCFSLASGETFTSSLRAAASVAAASCCYVGPRRWSQEKPRK